jgi:hypothetical protein
MTRVARPRLTAASSQTLRVRQGRLSPSPGLRRQSSRTPERKEVFRPTLTDTYGAADARNCLPSATSQYTREKAAKPRRAEYGRACARSARPPRPERTKGLLLPSPACRRRGSQGLSDPPQAGLALRGASVCSLFVACPCAASPRAPRLRRFLSKPRRLLLRRDGKQLQVQRQSNVLIGQVSTYPLCSPFGIRKDHVKHALTHKTSRS